MAIHKEAAAASDDQIIKSSGFVIQLNQNTHSPLPPLALPLPLLQSRSHLCVCDLLGCCRLDSVPSIFNWIPLIELALNGLN